jgi:biotin carboxylase
MARLLFLGASVSQLTAIRHAKRAGHLVIACDADREAVAFRYCDVREAVDFSDIDAVAAVGLRERVDGILAVCTDRAVVPAALVAVQLGLPGIDPEVARAMTNKGAMRARLREGGVPQPTYAVVRAPADLADISGVPLPAVLKPADSGGQRGLYRIERREQLLHELPSALAASRSGEAIVEEFVDGTELNSLFVVRNGEPTLLTISDRLRPTGLGFGVGWAHSYPSSLNPSVVEEVERVAADAIRCLGLRDGIAFPQLIAGRDRVVVVEVAARIAAGQMADLVKYATGIELYEIAIAQSIGKPVDDDAISPRFRRPTAIRFLTASPGVLPLGTVASISGLGRVRRAKGILAADLYFGIGAEIGALRVDADRRGYVIAIGPNAAVALDRADAAATKLRVGTASRSGSRIERAFKPLSVALVVALVVGTAIGMAVSEHAKLERALVTATRVDPTFSPVCRCRQRVDRIAFWLARPGRALVEIVTGTGDKVATLARPDGPGLVTLNWSGRGAGGARVPDGRYFPEVVFPTLGRTLRLPSPIVLDSDKPLTDTATLTLRPAAVVVHYRFGEPAQAALFFGRRRVVLTRFARPIGTIHWPRQHDATPRRERLSLRAIDTAGNRSRLRPLGWVGSASH